MTAAKFVTRSSCINCGSAELKELSSGTFRDQPLQGFVSSDPWGESPLPYLAGLTWRYVQCSQCGQAFHGEVLSPEWNEIRFSRWMTGAAMEEFVRRIGQPHAIAFEKGLHATRHVLQLEALTRTLRGARPLRLVDFGCGDGEFLKICSVYGFDANGVDRSEARRDKAGPRIARSLADLDGEFHVATLFEVLEHLDNPREILEALGARMVPGGILVLETPDCTGVRAIQTHHDYQCINPLDHINGFTPETLQSIAQRVGFEPIKAPVAQVTASPMRAAKRLVKQALSFALPATTQQYFRLR